MTKGGVIYMTMQETKVKNQTNIEGIIFQRHAKVQAGLRILKVSTEPTDQSLRRHVLEAAISLKNLVQGPNMDGEHVELYRGIVAKLKSQGR